MISSQEIAEAYRKLQGNETISSGVISIEEWITFAEMARFDPRLGEVLVVRLKDDFKAISPFQLREEALFKLREPATIGVLLDHAALLLGSSERKSFSHWKALTLDGIQKAPYQSFFIGLHPFANESLREAARHPHPIYARWGFYARDLMINKAQKWTDQATRTFVKPDERRKVLDQLIRKRERIETRDYLQELNGLVSRRQAEIDLSLHPQLVKRGRTRGAFWVKKRSPKPSSSSSAQSPTESSFRPERRRE